MDQDQFRQLLGSSTTSKSTTTSQPPRTKFGQSRPKPSSTTTSNVDSTTSFKPRQSNPLKKSNNNNNKEKKLNDGTGYRDRAAERRAGKESDFSQAEKLLQDFKARSEGTDKTTLEEQMKYLGGDATHSILVKGLDMALLERNKAELSKRPEVDLEEIEAQLDQQLDQLATVGEGDEGKRGGKGKGKQVEEVGKLRKKKGGGNKSRDELLAEMKAMRSSGSIVKGEEKESNGDGGLGKGWKKLSGGFAPVTMSEEPEKKRRKKKKKIVEGEGGGPESSLTPTIVNKPSEPSPLSKTTPKPEVSSDIKPSIEAAGDDDDDDIFGDAGSYKGLDDDSDSEIDAPTTTASKSTKKQSTVNSSSIPPPPPPIPSTTTTNTTRTNTKRKYFDDDEEEEGEEGISTAPVGVDDLASRQTAFLAAAEHHQQASSSTNQRRKQGGNGSDDEFEEEEEGTMPMKLQPLSGSRGPSVKELLQMDREAEEEEKRKAKKLKRQQKALESKDQDLSEADRANRDYLQMEAYLAKKKEGSSGGGGGGGVE